MKIYVKKRMPKFCSDNFLWFKRVLKGRECEKQYKFFFYIGKRHMLYSLQQRKETKNESMDLCVKE